MYANVAETKGASRRSADEKGIFSRARKYVASAAKKMSPSNRHAKHTKKSGQASAASTRVTWSQVDEVIDHDYIEEEPTVSARASDISKAEEDDLGSHGGHDDSDGPKEVQTLATN